VHSFAFKYRYILYNDNDADGNDTDDDSSDNSLDDDCLVVPTAAHGTLQLGLSDCGGRADNWQLNTSWQA
jgi:hypothetical protein